MNDTRDNCEHLEMTDDLAVREAARYFQAAYQRQMEGNLDEAIRLYERSIALHPTAEAHSFWAGRTVFWAIWIAPSPSVCGPLNSTRILVIPTTTSGPISLSAAIRCHLRCGSNGL